MQQIATIEGRMILIKKFKLTMYFKICKQINIQKEQKI